MKKVLVEQVNLDSVIVNDYDSNIQGIKSIYTLLYKNFNQPNLKFDILDKYINFNYKNKNLKLYFKKLTYSGNPHPIHEKRMQVGLNEVELQEFINQKLFIIGIYNYKDNIIFILPKLFKKIQERRWNNSSIAYVHTIDLINCTINGKFKKTDSKKNDIYLFKKLTDLLDFLITNTYEEPNESLKVLEKFVNENLNTNQIWYGKSCYQEMINADFKDKFQSEWPGFYLEFLFHNFLKINNISSDILKYLNIKGNVKELDFDLWISNSYYGDLKAHSLTSLSVLGNDKNSVMDAVTNYGKIWYLVLEYSAVLDKYYDFEVTKFWNTKLGKTDDLYSYGKKMKNRLLLSKFLVLEINKENLKYVEDFKQGVNSNNSERNLKIKISSKHQENFIIYRKTIEAK
ncbi:hypothetical protein [Spiroplasma melliferum]|uniref:Methylase-associated X1 domain-containing protein n=2 Tax=Spiroplasma melliferum TaxID=2134 RepID=A0AAI9T301_SPIME|nr:hypothetical protein [Spiroplasma melliferum]ELL44118.1 hypothetical protein SMIPMB4A_v3c9610 [Spiroplasma melliferum IPMB4A]KAI92463.1 hypothetical protein SPM_003950 [Spiroplasma melliferum KC3]QCO23912.1 hypothetical protein SRED_002392 [Spiroplasma melliferum]